MPSATNSRGRCGGPFLLAPILESQPPSKPRRGPLQPCNWHANRSAHRRPTKASENQSAGIWTLDAPDCVYTTISLAPTGRRASTTQIDRLATARQFVLYERRQALANECSALDSSVPWCTYAAAVALRPMPIALGRRGRLRRKRCDNDHTANDRQHEQYEEDYDPRGHILSCCRGRI